MESIWSKEVKLPERQPLRANIQADVAVIGAGMAGILTAYFLQKRGAHVVVLEARQTGSGQTQNTTAKITSQHGLIYHRLIEAFGLERARQYAQANQRALQQYKSLIDEHHIACHFEEQPSYVYTLDQLTPIEQEIAAVDKLDLPARFVTEANLPFKIQGAVCFDRQAQFNPLEFLAAIAKSLTVYERTFAEAVEGHTVVTAHGRVKAKSIVVATHYPFINVPGFYFMKMYQQRSYVIALENAGNVGGMYLDANDPGCSFRNYKNLLLIGGFGHRCGENLKGTCYENLRMAAKQYFPKSKETAYWSAQDCMTLDGVPYIGKYSVTTPHLYVATGFQKWGMTTAMASAQILSDTILGNTNPYAEVFSPQRFQLSASAKTLVENTTHALKGLGREFLTVPETVLADLPCEHGGLVAYNGQKVGVYKNKEGDAFVVSTKCPHLGCQLEWNPDELSWDCPCHGSRFDYRGNLIDNPAMESLSEAKPEEA